METNIRFPHDFYENLYEEIMNHEFNPESEDPCERHLRGECR